MAAERSTTPALEGLPRFFGVVMAVACLSMVYLVLQVGFVRPYLWPAGHGATLEGESAFAGSVDRTMLLARPPDVTDRELTIVKDVLPGSPAAQNRVHQGDEIVELSSGRMGEVVSLAELEDQSARLAAWRSAYRIGLRGPVTLGVRSPDLGDRRIEVERPPAWRTGAVGLWAKRHLGMTTQVIVFVTASVILLFLRSSDVTASLAVMALTLCAVGGAGPLMGSEMVLPPGLRQLMTLFAWIGAPFAFPFVGLAILYFPTRSSLLDRRPWLHAIPFIAALPMIALGTFTGLYLAGVDRLAGAALWDATHPTAYYVSFAAALAVNVWAIIEGVGRFRTNPNADERRRVRLAMYTTLPGVLAYALKDGLPVVWLLAFGQGLEHPWFVTAFLQALVLLPAFGVTYSVAVHRVLGPRVALRSSLQYALARKTLTALAVLPAVLLLASLIRQRDMTIGMIIRGEPLYYILTFGMLITAIKYRDRARAWLDRRFFREEYDAQKILLSLASRVAYQTDPNELTALVVNSIDEALHPETVAILVTGIENGRLTPVSVLHGSADSLPIDGGLVTMLRWSDEPLEIDLRDPKSPTRRLPPAEQDWLECTHATLLVPVTTPAGGSRSLMAVMVLGPKRSDQPYTADDRQVLSSIAAQISLALDVARLRSRASETETPTGAVASTETPVALLVECPTCGRCEDASQPHCPNDGTAMATILPIPRVVDNKYRIDQVVGRGGMGAVYRAHDLRLDRDVAIKVVRAELLGDPEARTRFRREAQIVARLQHPSVVSIFDYGTLPDGGAYLVMELVRGRDLREALKQTVRFSPDSAIRLVTAVCAAIDAAHRAGILHRDLKPENILLPQGDVEVKVLDFGVAKLVARDTTLMATSQAHETLTVHGQIIGTPAYMAPEQLRGGTVDARTDVFSLGVIAYEMLTGTLPFGKGPMVDIAMRHATGPAPLTGGVQPLDEGLDTAVRRALSLDPNERPSSPMAFAASLRAAVGGLPDAGRV